MSNLFSKIATNRAQRNLKIAIYAIVIYAASPGTIPVSSLYAPSVETVKPEENCMGTTVETYMLRSEYLTNAKKLSGRTFPFFFTDSFWNSILA